MKEYNELAKKLGVRFSFSIFTVDETNPFQNLNVDNFEDCGECKYKYLCGGGCRGRSYLRYGNINQKDAYCAMIFNYYKDLMIEVKKNLGGIS